MTRMNEIKQTCIKAADLCPDGQCLPCRLSRQLEAARNIAGMHQDRAEKFEGQRDEARRLKVPATTEALLLANMEAATVRTYLVVMKEERDAAREHAQFSDELAADRLEAFRKLRREIDTVVKDVRQCSSESIAQRFFNVLVANRLPDE